MKKSFPETRLIFMRGAFLIFVALFNFAGHRFPLDDPFNKSQGYLFPGENIHDVMHPLVYRSLNPNMAGGINDPHPYPDYMKKFIHKGNFPAYYRDLLNMLPKDHLQDKVFDPVAFSKVNKIYISLFENKTLFPFRDENAGKVVSTQVFQELRNSNNYAVTPSPKIMGEEYQMRIRANSAKTLLVPEDQAASKPGKNGGKILVARKQGEPVQPFSSQGADAIMMGAVTKYRDTYIDTRGQRQKSIAAGLEFGAFLISVKTGKVIWGARYVATQTPRITEFFRSNGQWLNKREFSRTAMKNVLKVFYEKKSASR
ncbi:MAG: hypothetical protein ACE5GQ_05730 [Nitrospinales bacterium]